jgi:hypothetical protein
LGRNRISCVGMFPHALGFRICANGSTRRRIAGTMNHYIRTFAILTVVGLSGCPVTQVNRIPESSPLPRATEITAAGDFRHNRPGISSQSRWVRFSAYISFSMTLAVWT